jgi:hypothetical protein
MAWVFIIRRIKISTLVSGSTTCRRAMVLRLGVKDLALRALSAEARKKASEGIFGQMVPSTMAGGKEIASMVSASTLAAIPEYLADLGMTL